MCFQFHLQNDLALPSKEVQPVDGSLRKAFCFLESFQDIEKAQFRFVQGIQHKLKIVDDANELEFQFLVVLVVDEGFYFLLKVFEEVDSCPEAFLEFLCFGVFKTYIIKVSILNHLTHPFHISRFRCLWQLIDNIEERLAIFDVFHFFVLKVVIFIEFDHYWVDL